MNHGFAVGPRCLGIFYIGTVSFFTREKNLEGESVCVGKGGFLVPCQACITEIVMIPGMIPANVQNCPSGRVRIRTRRVKILRNVVNACATRGFSRWRGMIADNRQIRRKFGLFLNLAIVQLDFDVDVEHRDDGGSLSALWRFVTSFTNLYTLGRRVYLFEIDRIVPNSRNTRSRSVGVSRIWTDLT